MATKWKNICDKILKIWKEEKQKLLGILMILIAFILLFELLIVERYLYRPTRVIWIVGLCSNAFLGFGLTVFLRAHLFKKYSNWVPADETFFDEWKMKWNAQQKKLMYIGVPLLLFVWFAGWNWYHYLGYYSNYAPIYLSIATVIIQYFVCQVCIHSFMKGKLELLMECMTDVSKMKLEEAMVLERESLKRAAKSEQLKVDLISNVSHDLKTPLTSMVGYIELMKKEELSDVTRDYVDVISDKAERLKEMIESLFSIAKVSSGNVELNPEEIELNMLIEQIFADMSDKMENSGLKFVKALTDEDTCLVTDNLYMYRICQNLIENAIKYSAAGTRVFIKTFVKEIGGKEKISMEITNTAGYEMDFDKEDILERFARGDKARTSEGNGAGLAIVSTYAGALGGAFDINIDCDQFKATVTFPRDMSVER